MTTSTLSPWIARLARIAGIVLLVYALCPSFEGKGGGATHSERWYLGWPTSPLADMRNTSTEELDSAGAKSVVESSTFEVGFVSWSMAALAGGIVLLSLARALRREAKSRAPSSAAS